MSLLKSIFNVAKDVTEIALAPVEIAVDLTRQVTKPIAEAAKEVVEDVKSDVEEE